MRYLCLFILLGVTLQGCTGPKGDAGPMGPSGPSQPTYYYNNNFDSGGVSEWMVHPSIGGGSISRFLDNTLFNSPGQSLAVSETGGVGCDGVVYMTLAADMSKDFWIEADINTGELQGSAAIYLTQNSSKPCAYFYINGGIYIYQDATPINVVSTVDPLGWHHLKIKVAAKSMKSSYWFDGQNLGTDYSVGNVEPCLPNGSYFGINEQTSTNSTFRLDNLQCYRY